MNNAVKDEMKTGTPIRQTRSIRVPQLVSREGKPSTAMSTSRSIQYAGEPSKFDSNIRGPVENRNCTDVFCCLTFIIVVIGYVVLGTMAWIQGDPRKLVFPTDSYGQFCGQTPNEDKTILFYFNMLKCANPDILTNRQCPTTQICVSTCPDRFATLLDTWNTNNWDYYSQFCKPGFKISTKSPTQVIQDEDCPPMIVPSRPLLQRCFPDFSTTNGNLNIADQTSFKDGENKDISVDTLKVAATSLSSLLNAKHVTMKIFEDYANSWFWILIGLVIAMVESLLFILLLRYTAGAIWWLVLVSVVTGVAYGIWHCYSEYNTLSKEPNTNMTFSEILLNTDVSDYLQLSQTWLFFMVLLSVLEAIIVITLIFLRRRLFIAIALLKEGSEAISYIVSTLFYPIITFFLLAICITYWAVTAVFLASSREAVYKVTADKSCTYVSQTCNPKDFDKTTIPKECPASQCLFASYSEDTVYHNYTTVLHLCNLLVLLWLVNFAIALGQCALAGAFASYYWALKKPNDIPDWPLYTSFSTAIRYHTGSVAFGSLILSIVQIVRFFLEYLDHKLKGSQNAFTRYLLCCFKCCFWCLEHFIRFLSRNAYIMIAIYGKNFCTSAKHAFFLLKRNIIRVAVLDKVTDFLLFLGKVLISGSVGVFAFMFFTNKLPSIEADVPALHYYWVPLVTVIFGSYMIAQGFFNVYAMCVDTLFLCFCEDLERNGSSSRSYMSPGLHTKQRRVPSNLLRPEQLWDLEVNDGSRERPFHMGKSLKKIFMKKKT